MARLPWFDRRFNRGKPGDLTPAGTDALFGFFERKNTDDHTMGRVAISRCRCLSLTPPENALVTLSVSREVAGIVIVVRAHARADPREKRDVFVQ